MYKREPFYKSFFNVFENPWKMPLTNPGGKLGSCTTTLFLYKNNFIRTPGWDFAQIWGKVKNNLRTFEAETLKICQKSYKIDRLKVKLRTN